MSDNIGTMEIISTLPPEECAARLRGVTDRLGWGFVSGWRGSGPLLGCVSERSFRVCKRIGYRNGFQPFLTARIEAHGTGSMIRGSFAMQPMTRMFMAIWFGGVVVIGGVMAAAAARAWMFDPAPAPNRWMGVLMPFLMLAFGATLVWFGRYLARDEPAFLTAFLTELLDAKPDLRNS